MALGVLMALGVSKTMEEAEKKLQSIRPEAAVHPLLKEDVMELFSSTKTTDNL